MVYSSRNKSALTGACNQYKYFPMERSDLNAYIRRVHLRALGIKILRSISGYNYLDKGSGLLHKGTGTFCLLASEETLYPA
eukprot:scaffold44136_cov47-Prasinocladus_malaysianus.AAC.2